MAFSAPPPLAIIMLSLRRKNNVKQTSRELSNSPALRHGGKQGGRKTGTAASTTLFALRENLYSSALEGWAEREGTVHEGRTGRRHGRHEQMKAGKSISVAPVETIGVASLGSALWRKAARAAEERKERLSIYHMDIATRALLLSYQPQHGTPTTSPTSATASTVSAARAAGCRCWRRQRFRTLRGAGGLVMLLTVGSLNRRGTSLCPNKDGTAEDTENLADNARNSASWNACCAGGSRGRHGADGALEGHRPSGWRILFSSLSATSAASRAYPRQAAERHGDAVRIGVAYRAKEEAFPAIQCLLTARATKVHK